MNQTVMKKSIDQSEQSYELGRFLGVMRQMEAELLLHGYDTHPNKVDQVIPYFIQSPSTALDETQYNLMRSQKLVHELNKTQLLHDMREVFALIDVPFLDTISLHAENFMNGFREQCQSYQ